ncbi:MAG: hypothetical protein LUH21_02705 [Clostridiales bacterium]|nr:hypothetical protein [Clostridiales bacterium]
MKKIITMITAAAFAGALTISSFASTSSKEAQMNSNTNPVYNIEVNGLGDGLNHDDTSEDSVYVQKNTEKFHSELGSDCSVTDTRPDTLMIAK